MSKKLAWLCQFTATTYDMNAPEIAGQGQPPSSPQTPAGLGSVPMTLITLDDETGEVITAAQVAAERLKSKIQTKTK